MWVDDREVRRAIVNVEAAVSSPSMEQFLSGRVDPYLKGQAEIRFRREGDSRTGKWKPLAKYTQRDRVWEGYGAEHPINVRTGDLHDYITRRPGVSRSGAGQAFLTLPGPGTALQEEKLSVAQRGKARNSIGAGPDGREKLIGSVPARPVLAMNMLDNRQIMRRLEQWVIAGVSGNTAALRAGRG